MAYETHSISAITDVPELVGAFAATLGFETDLSVSTQPIIWNPMTGSNSNSNSGNLLEDALRWRVRATAAGVTHRLFLEIGDESSNSPVNDVVTSVAETTSPIVGDPGAALLPSTLHLIGALTPEPYIAVILEYDDGHYRHMYIGNLEKIGTFEGGEVISGMAGPLSSVSLTISYKDDDHMKYLFSSRSVRQANDVCGGAYVEAGSNAEVWRRFYGNQSASPYTAFPDDTILGGFMDAINDGYLARARSAFANVNILVPINLYVNENITGDASFRPVGRPAGVRLVNMQDLTPGAEIVVGGYEWRVFPSHRRSAEANMDRATSSGIGYRSAESSLWVGYAYATAVEDSNSPS